MDVTRYRPAPRCRSRARQSPGRKPTGRVVPTWRREFPSPTTPDMYLALIYDLVDDYLQRRPAYREEHLALAAQAHRDGRLVLAGAFQPPDGALLVFKADSPSAVEEFVQRDPYVKNGLVKSWRIREWTVVIGEATPPPITP